MAVNQQSSPLTAAQAIELYQQCDLHELGRQSNAFTRQLHPGNQRTYIIERNINYTNICQCRCRFCAFSVTPQDSTGYVLTYGQLAQKVQELYQLGGRQILLQGGMHPDLPFDWYLQMLEFLRREFPDLHIHAFSPPEIVFFSKTTHLNIKDVLLSLLQAGLNTIPGGGAEILVDRVRQQIAPAKCTADQWLDVMRQAHRLGICTTATMMFGHTETLAERIEHLDRLRQLQDESLAYRKQNHSAGYFTAFTCWPFQPTNTRLGQDTNLHLAGAYEQLKMTAISRLFLENIHNFQASWITQGPQVGQLQLVMGCNDLGSLMIEENVVSAAGTQFQLKHQDLHDLIRTAGFEPIQRDYYYCPSHRA